MLHSLLDPSKVDPMPMDLPVDIRLAVDIYVYERYFQLELPDPMIMSGFEVTTNPTNYVKSFEARYVEMNSLFPDRWKQIELVTGQAFVS